MFCNNCGEQLNNNDVFCQKCGVNISGAQNSNNNGTPMNSDMASINAVSINNDLNNSNKKKRTSTILKISWPILAYFLLVTINFIFSISTNSDSELLSSLSFLLGLWFIPNLIIVLTMRNKKGEISTFFKIIWPILAYFILFMIEMLFNGDLISMALSEDADRNQIVVMLENLIGYLFWINLIIVLVLRNKAKKKLN